MASTQLIPFLNERGLSKKYSLKKKKMLLLENSTVMCHQFKKIIFVSSIINLQWHFRNVFVKSAYLSKRKHSFHSELKALCRNDAPFFLLLRLNIDPFSKRFLIVATRVASLEVEHFLSAFIVSNISPRTHTHAHTVWLWHCRLRHAQSLISRWHT